MKQMMSEWPLQAEEQGAEQPGATAGSGDTPPAAGLDVNWDALDKEYEALDAEPEAAVAPAAPTPEPEQASEPTPAQAPAQAQEPTPQQAPESVPTQAPEPAQAPAPTVSREQLREQYVSQLASRYALNDDDARAMLTEPEKVIPKLAAQLHVDVVDTVVNTIFARLPSLVMDVQKQEVANREAEESFFKVWPQLRDERYKNVVWNAVANYRALNPQAKRDEVIRAAGLSAMLHLRLPLPAELMQFEQPAAPQPRAFTPAAPGAGAPPPPPAGPVNPFVALSEEFLADDRGG